MIAGLTLLNFVFQYDNVLMEEAAQILEIETFIPLLLQVGKDFIVFVDYTFHARGDSKGKWDFKRERDRRAWKEKRKPPSRLFRFLAPGISAFIFLPCLPGAPTRERCFTFADY